MILLLAGLVLQAPSADPLDRLAAAYAGGDETARGPLLRAGPYAILSLRKARERDPRRVDAFLFEAKTALAGASAAEASRSLSVRRTLELADTSFREAWIDLSDELPILYDPAFNDEVLGRKLSLLRTGVAGWEILDAIARELGLDWGYYHGRALFSRPERLWPSGPPPRPASLAGEEADRAARWIEQLGSDAPEERTQAAEGLGKLGPAAIPLLERGVMERQGEIAARCRELLGRARAPAATVFRAPAAERQKLEAKDAAFRRALEEKTVTIRCSYQPLESFLQIALQPQKVPYETGPSLGGGRVFADFTQVPAWTVVSLVTQACDCDFILRDGKIVVDSRDAIDRRR